MSLIIKGTIYQSAIIKVKYNMIKLVHFTFFVSIFLIFGCNTDASNQDVSVQDAPNQERSQQSIETVEVEKSPKLETTTVNTSNRTIISNFFDEGQTKKLYSVKAQFDEAMCSQISYIEISDCYSTHAAILMADLTQDIPFTANFPYTTDFAFSKFEQEFEDLEILSSKCGLQNPQNKEIVNFYCLYDVSPFMDYLAELGKATPFIKSIHELYQKAKGMPPSMRNDVVLSSKLELDFNKIDHQFFYMIMHLALNDEYIATQVLKKQLK